MQKIHTNGIEELICMEPLLRHQVSYITRGDLRDAVEELFKSNSEIAVFYFSGHGSIDSLGGYLCTSEVNRPDDGLSLNDIMGFVATSKAPGIFGSG